MAKIGRNEPCSCGSGKKYKHCCGRPSLSSRGGARPSPEDIGRMQLESARREAREHQRRLVQGLGRPIISFESNGYRIVCIGNKIRWSKVWRTFPDFLFDYIKFILTPEWGNAELKKPESARHPLIKWYHKVCDFQRAHLSSEKGGLYQAEMTGSVKAYLGLAYDLYLCAHNAELPELLLKRLRNAQTFEGALYEAYVIGRLAKAGFKIDLEDESDSMRSHCELTATHKETGRKFSVEAKAVTSMSTRAGHSAAPPKIRGKLHQALQKRADHERLIFIEVNRAEIGVAGQIPDWAGHVDTELAEAERDLTIDGQPAPRAYIFATNRSFMHALDSDEWTEAAFACGFKINDFASRTGARSILDLVNARERHIEMHWLGKAMKMHGTIPNTFDDRLAEEVFADGDVPRLLIGSAYLLPGEHDGEVIGVLKDASVLETESAVYGTYQLQDGRHMIYKSDISQSELATYRRSPSTFFGVLKDAREELNAPLDYFDFLWNVYSNTSRDRLLEFIKDWPDFALLSTLEQRELAKAFCARTAEMMWLMRGRGSA